MPGIAQHRLTPNLLPQQCLLLLIAVRQNVQRLLEIYLRGRLITVRNVGLQRVKSTVTFGVMLNVTLMLTVTITLTVI